MCGWGTPDGEGASSGTESSAQQQPGDADATEGARKLCSAPPGAESASQPQAAGFAARWSRALSKRSPTGRDRGSVPQPAHAGRLGKALFIVARYLLR